MCSIVSDLAFGWMLLVVTIDRFFAVFAPVRYFKTGHLYAWKMLGVVLLKSTLCLFLAFIFTRRDTRLEVSPFCYTADSVDETIGFAFAIVRIVTVACSIVLYLPICLRLYTLAKQKRVGKYSTRRYAQLKNMTLAVALSSASGILFVLIPDTISAFDIFGLKKYSSYFFILLFAKSISTVSIYFFRWFDPLL
uniref:G_PROTEIN_RECEP_F1_2 domain-containing protein n=1 Tax=Steinernema glaseri TaxID=37863 RepID=A0A1I7YEZ8_9BILA